jgi:hypothetical protein
MPVSDTSPEAFGVQIECVRRLGPEGRGRRALEMSQSSRSLLRAGIRQRHPDYTEREVDLALFRLLLAPELWRAAYSDAPDLAP